MLYSLLMPSRDPCPTFYSSMPGVGALLPFLLELLYILPQQLVYPLKFLFSNVLSLLVSGEEPKHYP